MCEHLPCFYDLEASMKYSIRISKVGNTYNGMCFNGMMHPISAFKTCRIRRAFSVVWPLSCTFAMCALLRMRKGPQFPTWIKLRLLLISCRLMLRSWQLALPRRPWSLEVMVYIATAIVTIFSMHILRVNPCLYCMYSFYIILTVNNNSWVRARLCMRFKLHDGLDT